MPPIKGRRAAPTVTNAKGHRSNTLGLSDHETTEVLEKLDSKSPGKAAVKRTYTRMPFRVSSLTLNMAHPGGSKTSVQVVCRNLSRSGIGVLHGSFAHTGTRCAVGMPTLGDGTDHLEGTIVRCTHVSGQIHELGILFDEEINVGKYLDVDPSAGISTFEHVDPEKLEGTAVALVSSEIEGRMLGHFLSESNLKLKITSDPAEGASLLAEGCDIAIIDVTVPCAEEMALAARQSSSGLPLIAVAGESSRETRALAGSMGVSGFLLKPFISERVLSTIAECLLCSEAVLPGDDASGALSPELIAACIDQLHKIIGKLRDAANGEDAMQCYALCQQIKATSAPIGLDEVGDASERASTTISQSMSVSDSQKAIQDLLRLCERVKKPAA